ncbi:MAG: hypothetical protein V4754_03860 [Pseudomonadota bacterium]
MSKSDFFGLSSEGNITIPIPCPIGGCIVIPNGANSASGTDFRDDGDDSRGRGRESTADARSRNRGGYHDICDQREPPGLTKCNSAKFRLNRAQQCFAARKDHADRKYGGNYDRGHQQQMDQLVKAIENAEKDVEIFCKCP